MTFRNWFFFCALPKFFDAAIASELRATRRGESRWLRALAGVGHGRRTRRATTAAESYAVGPSSCEIARLRGQAKTPLFTKGPFAAYFIIVG